MTSAFPPAAPPKLTNTAQLRESTRIPPLLERRRQIHLHRVLSTEIRGHGISK